MAINRSKLRKKQLGIEKVRVALTLRIRESSEKKLPFNCSNTNSYVYNDNIIRANSQGGHVREVG